MWTPVSQINIVQQNWQCVATNYNGTVLIAAIQGGDIWINTKGLWINIVTIDETNINTTNQQWSCVASSFSGTKLFASANGGDLWKSIDSGDTWTNMTASIPIMTGKKWTSITTDSSGNNLYASSTNTTTNYNSTGGSIWYSEDGGISWSMSITILNQNWQSVATNQNGSVAIACVKGGDLWIRYENIWYSSGIANQNWKQVVISADGNFFAGCVSGGDIWRSYGDGYWSYSNNIQNWRSITMDTSGQNIFACANENDIWTSRDKGNTWTKSGMSYKNWKSIASDSTGEKLIACEITIWLNITQTNGPTPFADICFVKNTLIQTDQGQVPIQQLIPGKHTLFKQYIIAVTETIHTDSHLVKVSAYAFGAYPTKDTYVSRNHKINGIDTFQEAQDYVNGTTVTFVPYSREPLYNVLCERPSFMKVHGMMAETLDPQTDIALYHKSKRYRRL